MIGERLGKWLIEKELGHGGMGRVYLARDEATGKQAAVKVLAAELAMESGFLHRFEREIESLAILDHPNIVRFYEAGSSNGLFYYAMEYVDGTSLDQVLFQEGKLPWNEVLDIALQLCPALKHVHDHGIIHRDIKPPNILRAKDGTVMLTDFGIAKVFAHSNLTATGGVVGTAEFLSPEQAAGKPVSKRSDLYSLGVVLYMMLTGRPPFEGTNFVELLHKHRYGQFDRPKAMAPETPYELDELICSLLEKDPAKRPADCMVLGRQLDSIRRKLDRKSNLTAAGWDQEPTVVENQPAAQRPDDRPGPATLMSRLMREELERQRQGTWLSRLFNRGAVLATLLIVVIGILAWTFWPPSSESLFRQGAALMESEELSDWERAWREYLGPLSQRAHHPYEKELEGFRKKIDRARNQGEQLSEAQRFVQRGEWLAQEGRLAEAHATWMSVKAVFQGIKGEERRVERTERHLADLDRAANNPQRWEGVKQALERAATLRDQGQRAEAEHIWAGIESLYQGNEEAKTILDELRAARKKP